MRWRRWEKRAGLKWKKGKNDIEGMGVANRRGMRGGWHGERKESKQE